MNLVTSKAVEPARIESFAESLCADLRTVIKFSLPVVVPREYLCLQKVPQALGISGIRSLTLTVIFGIAAS
jgi:hypothetical protein